MSDDSGCASLAQLSIPHLLHAASGKMTHSSNVFIHWSTINSAATFILTRRIQGSVQKSIFINDAIKDFKFVT